MNTSRLLRRLSMSAFLCAAIILSSALSARAQAPPDLVKMAGAIPLTKDLLSHVKSFLQKLPNDADAKAEYLKMGRDKDTTPENVNSVIYKYPKLEAAFKASSLKPDEFVKAWGALMIAPSLAELDTPVEDKIAQANAEFCKANSDEVKSIGQSIEALEKETTAPSSSPSP
jgi:hypothetical protein